MVQNQHMQKNKAKTALVGICGHMLLKRIVASGHNTQACVYLLTGRCYSECLLALCSLARPVVQSNQIDSHNHYVAWSLEAFMYNTQSQNMQH